MVKFTRVALVLALTLCASGFAAQPPIISDVDIAPSDTPLTTELVTFAVNARSPDGLVLKIMWNYGDGTESQSGQSVTHTFVASGNYDVTTTVNDGVNPPVLKVSHLQVIASPPRGSAAGVNQGESETNPDGGISSTVVSSAAGVVELQLASTTDSNTETATDFGDGGRIAHGPSPRHAYASPGIYIATSTVTDDTSGSAVGIVRKTLVISAQDVPQVPAPNSAPVVPLLQPHTHGLAVSAFMGKFNLKSHSQLDTVNLTFILELPAGLELLSNHAITLSVGNVVETVMLNRKGLGVGSQRYKRVKVLWPTGTKASLTSTGQSATMTVQMASADLRSAGFDSDGISLVARSVQPRIQIGVLLEGIAWSAQVPVALKISPRIIVATLGSK